MGSGFNSVSSAANFVKDVAQQSYGSRLGEGTSGGAGAIGMIGDKVVKFNTHRSERKGAVTADMLRTSDQLRQALGSAAKKLSETKPGQTRADQMRYLQKIYKELGLTDEGFLPAEGGKSLLSRKVTAKVVKMIDQMRLSSGAGQVDSFDTWSVRSSRNKDTSFESVRAETEKSIAREEASAESAKADAARNPLVGNNIKGSLKPDLAKTIAKQLLSMPSKYVTKEMHEKISDLITKLLDTGVEPNKAVRLAYALTEGLDKAAEKYSELLMASKPRQPEVSEKPKEPKKPTRRQIPFKPENPAEPTGLFASARKLVWNKTAKPDQDKALAEYRTKLDAWNVQDQKAEKEYGEAMAEYDKAMTEYGKAMKIYEREQADLAEWQSECKAIDEANKKNPIDFAAEVCKTFFNELEGKMPNLSAMSENSLGRLMDSLMLTAQKDIDVLCPELFAKTAGAGLQKLDGRLAHRIQMETARQPASASVPTSAMLKVDMNTVLEKTMSKIKQIVTTLAEDNASFKDLSVVPDPKNPNTMLVKLSEFNVKEAAIEAVEKKAGSVIAGTLRGASFKDLTIPIKFGCDPTTGKMQVNIQRMQSTDKPDYANSFSMLIADTVKPFIFAMLAESPLAGDLHIEGRVDSPFAPIGNLDKIAELDEKEMFPIEISPSADRDVNMYDLKIDPSKFTPFESLGLPPGSKVTGFEMKDGIMSVQVGGKAGEVKNLSDVKGGVAAQVSVGKPQLKMMTDEVAKLMREKGISLGDLKITTSEKTGTIRLDITDMDASGFLKGIPGAAATGVRLFQKGSYGITFRPQVDPKTGTMVLALQEVESKTNPNKVAVLNLGAKVATAFAKVVFGGSSDFKVEKPTTRKPGEKPYMTQIRMTPEGLSKLLPKLDGKSQPSIRPDNLKVTDEGLTFGMTGKI